MPRNGGGHHVHLKLCPIAQPPVTQVSHQDSIKGYARDFLDHRHKRLNVKRLLGVVLCWKVLF